MMRNGEILGLSILLTAFFSTILVYSKLPQEMITNWAGEMGLVSGFSKNSFVTIYLGAIFGIFLLFTLISRINALKPETKETQRIYSTGLNLVLLIYFSVGFSTVLFNLGFKINFLKIAPFGFGLLLFWMGRAVQHAQPHWFLSLRTP